MGTCLGKQPPPCGVSQSWEVGGLRSCSGSVSLKTERSKMCCLCALLRSLSSESPYSVHKSDPISEA